MGGSDFDDMLAGDDEPADYIDGLGLATIPSKVWVATISLQR